MGLRGGNTMSGLMRQLALIALVAILVSTVGAAAQGQVEEIGKLNIQAMKLYEARKYAEATVIAKRSLDLAEKHPGPSKLFVSTSLNNLALIYAAQGHYAEAEPLYKRSLALYETALDHRQVGSVLNNLAGMYKTQGRYTEAEPLYKRSLALREKAVGPGHSDVGTTLDALAGLYRRQGRYAEAEPLYKRTLALSEKALGANHPNVGISLNNLALLYEDQGRYAEVSSSTNVASR
jgi:tetratricopeptide (TPR) repeat protein